LLPVFGRPFIVQMAWSAVFEIAGIWMVRMRLCTSAERSLILVAHFCRSLRWAPLEMFMFVEERA